MSIRGMKGLLFSTLRRILVVQDGLFGPFQFDIATLPINYSGLGISNPADISQFAYLASLHET